MIGAVDSDRKTKLALVPPALIGSSALVQGQHSSKPQDQQIQGEAFVAD